MLPQAPARMTVHWLWKAIYVLGLVLFLGLTLVSLLNRQSGPAIFFLGFSVLMVLAMILARSYVEVDHDKILVYGPPLGKYMIRWDEISSVETNGVGYVFRGNDKALGFNTMMGNKAVSIHEAIGEQVARRGIEVTRVRRIPSTMPKNTKIT